MTPIVIALITAGSAIVVAFFGYLGVITQRTHANSKAALGEVRNSHQTNLRDDLDEKFKALGDQFQGLSTDLADVKLDLSGVKKDVGGLKEDVRIIRRDQTTDRQAVAEERERIRDLEHTSPNQRTTRPRRNPQ